MQFSSPHSGGSGEDIGKGVGGRLEDRNWEIRNHDCSWFLIMSGHIDASEDSEMVWECSPCRRVAWKSVDSNSLLQLTSLTEKRKWVWGSIWKGEDECWGPSTFILHLRGSAESLVLWGSVIRICWLNLTLLSKALSFTLTSMGCSFQIESWHKTPEVPSKKLHESMQQFDYSCYESKYGLLFRHGANVLLMGSL